MLVRGLLIAFLALLASGCNLLVADESWLEQVEDEAEPHKFRDGLWIIEGEKCRFDEAKALAEWPSCADFVVISSNTWYSPEWEEGPVDGLKLRMTGWTAQSTLIVSGDPAMIEVKVTQKDEASDEERESPYMYLGLRLVSADKQGKATAIRLWPARCGPVRNPSRRVSSDGRTVGTYVTSQPFPGLIIDSYNCKAQSLDALKSAIRSSEDLADNVRRARWVRSGWK
jgi:hypothetical protein